VRQAGHGLKKSGSAEECGGQILPYPFGTQCLVQTLTYYFLILYNGHKRHEQGSMTHEITTDEAARWWQEDSQGYA
jgi:hypothetical protein